MANAWTPFYWADYLADTSHLTLAEHGAYLLLMAHYYRKGPLPANASLLHRICRCENDTDRVVVDKVLAAFFTVDGQVYRHKRIDREIAKSAAISEKRRAAAISMHANAPAHARANAPANGDAKSMHLSLQSQSQPHPQPEPQTTKGKVKSVCADAHVRAHHQHPTLNEVTTYCLERGGKVDPQAWFDHYQANGWRVGRCPMKDWKAAVRTWERNELNSIKGNGNGTNKAQQREADIFAAGEEAKRLLRNAGIGQHSPGLDH